MSAVRWDKARHVVVRARHVVPVDSPPIENGAIEIRDGIITCVGPATGHTNLPVRDLGDMVLLPGFVNAHTHLELSYLAGRVPTGEGFVPWLERLVSFLKIWGDVWPLISEATREGVSESLAAGVTTVADVTRRPAIVRRILRDKSLRALSFGEVIAAGRLRSELTTRLEAAVDTSCVSERLRIGITPHSPYAVEPDALQTCTAWARERALPLCIHLAETPDEEEFTVRGTGPLRGYLERVGVWDDAVPCAGRRPVELAAECGLLGPTTILAHGNYVSDADIEIIARSGAHVAWCPRTHRAFGHAPHPFRRMLAAGVNVCVGTDSLASNPSLSVLDELRFVRREHPDLPPELILAMGTLHGARATGWADRVGSLRPGKDADWVAVRYNSSGPANPIENVLASTARPAAVYVRGRRASSRARLT